MDWVTIATLIARYGIPFVEKLIQNSQNNSPVTPAEWAALLAKVEIPGDALIPKTDLPVPKKVG